MPEGIRVECFASNQHATITSIVVPKRTIALKGNRNSNSASTLPVLHGSLDEALARLRKICDDQIPADYEIEIVDLSRNPELASRYQIVATPTILRTLPAPVRKGIGDLSNRDKALLGFDLSASRRPSNIPSPAKARP